MAQGKIPQEVFDRVLGKTSIVDVVGDYVQLTKAGRNYKGLCPFHGENTPSFVVSPDKGIYKCFGCGMGGNAISFVSQLEGISFPQAVAKLAQRAGIEVSDLPQTALAPATADSPQQKQYEALEFAQGFFHYFLLHSKEGAQARGYLKERGISDESIAKFGIGLAPSLRDGLAQTLGQNELSLPDAVAAGLLGEHNGRYYDRFKSRIMFPIRDPNGKAVGFSGRSYLPDDDSMSKYINSPETGLFVKNRLVYNFSEARLHIRRQNRVLLFEGFLDVISAVKAGFLESVATMGTALTENHAALLRRVTDQVLICYDGDKAGNAATNKAISILKAKQFNVSVVELPQGMDPDDYISKNGVEAFGQLVSASVPAVDYQYRFEKRQLNLEFISHQEAFKKTIFYLAKIQETPTLQELILKKLAADINVGESGILKEFQNENHQVYKNPGFNNNKNEMHSAPKKSRGSSKYEKSEKMLIFYMLKERGVALKIDKELNCALNDTVRRNIAMYILDYYTTQESMNLQYFLNWLDEEMVKSLTEILFDCESLPEAPAEGVIDDLIAVVKEYVYKIQVEQLKRQIGQAATDQEKLELLGKVSQLKQQFDS
ncbi:MAG: DNA primase [Turicibacter sp.]|nr:DNA primase [Turicibacter sp.]